MKKLSTILEIRENAVKKLEALGFRMVDSEDKGMHKFCTWANEQMKFSLLCDRGYYDCHIEPLTVSEQYMDIIWLLRFIYDNKNLYEEELESANLSNTLPPEDYIDLLIGHYSLISEFMATFNERTYLGYKNFPNN